MDRLGHTRIGNTTGKAPATAHSTATATKAPTTRKSRTRPYTDSADEDDHVASALKKDGPVKRAATTRKSRTRRYADSADEDDDDANALKKDGPAKRTRSRTRVTKDLESPVVESEDEDMADGDKSRPTLTKGKGTAKTRFSGMSALLVDAPTPVSNISNA